MLLTLKHMLERPDYMSRSKELIEQEVTIEPELSGGGALVQVLQGLSNRKVQ